MSPKSDPAAMGTAEDPPAGTKEVPQLMDAPRGQPTTYGPVPSADGRQDRQLAVNPFWSDAVKEDALIRSLRPQGLPEGSSARGSQGLEDGAEGIPDVRQLMSMILQQNAQLKKELDDLRGQVRAQPTQVVEQVLGKAEERSVSVTVEPTQPAKDPALLPLEDVKSEAKSEEMEFGAGTDCRTPPESVSAKKPQGSVVDPSNSNETHMSAPPVSGAAGTQTQVLGQVTEALTSLVAQLTAVSHGTQGQGQVACRVPGQGPQLEGVQGHLHGGGRGQVLNGAGVQGHGHGSGQPPNGDGQGQGSRGPPGDQGCGGHSNGYGFGHGGRGGGHGMGYGGAGIPNMAPFHLPQEMMWFPGMNENVRSVELPPLPGVREGELGGTVVGDWMTLVAPIMKDLSASSCVWWDAITKAAGEAYQTWLQSDPLHRLYVAPTVPPECSTTWSRVEQRGQTMLLQALPESLKSEILSTRSTNTVEILFKIYVRYQPGGLGEKALLLRQLVDGKVPGGSGELVEQVRAWKRNLRRAQELGVMTPDPTLLIGALDRMSSAIIKTSSQMAFRLNSARAQLMVDVSPTLTNVTSYAGAIMAEAEGLLHAGTQTNTTAKVKAMEAMPVEAAKKGDGKGKSVEKTGKGPVCKFFGTEDGCKKGQDCTYTHDWSLLDPKGPARCWTCSSTKHTKKDCTVKAINGVEASSGDRGGKGKKGQEKGKGSDPAPVLKKSEKTDEAVKPSVEEGNGKTSTGHLGGEGDSGRMSSAAPAQELLTEAASLLKSLRLPAMKAMRISSLEVQTGGRTLLDGGATHALRMARDSAEFEMAQEVQVELAQGSITLRQLPWSRTLLSDTPVQSIVPLGVLAEIGYSIHWEGVKFELVDPHGCVLDTQLDSGCTTVDETLGLELIKEVERHFIQRRARLAVLRGEGNPGDLSDQHVKELRELKEMFPLVPDNILVRILPRQEGRGRLRGEDLPWNRHQRRRLRKAQQVIVHLFSGKDEAFWKKELETADRAVLCLDTELDARHDLLKDEIMEFLMDLADSGGAEDPMAEEEDHAAAATMDEKVDDTEKWKEKIEEEEGFLVKQITFVEILPDRSGPAVISGLSRIHARLRYMGLPLMRLHSDRAGELRSRAIRRWAEERRVYRTYTDGDSFKSNGRVEAEINMIKKQVRVLLKETGFNVNLWPLAARHAAERRMRQQLDALNCPTRPLLQFGREGYATQKIWNEKYQDWKMVRRKVTVMGPDVAMSASMPGYYVKGEDGKYFHSADVATAEGPPPEARLEDAELGLLHDHGVRRRITGKTPMLSRLQADPGKEKSMIQVEEIEERRIRGIRLLMEELDIQDAAVSDASDPVLEEVRAGTDCFIRALLADVENLAGDLIEVEEEMQAHETQVLEAAAGDQEVFLQTRSYALSEVKANLADWKESMEAEFRSLTEETGAIKIITEAQAEELRRDADRRGILYDRIPAKAIFQRKAGSGRRKCRACACGNFMAQRPASDTYAGGTGAAEVRTLLRTCGLRGWSAVTLDVKTAFLRAPKNHSNEVVIVQPPQIFILAGVCAPGTLWWVDRAMYGLITSPKEWLEYRNRRVINFKWSAEGINYSVEKTSDPDIWKIIKEDEEKTSAPVQRCRAPDDQGDGTASTGGAPAYRCRAPEEEQGDGTAFAGGTAVGFFVTYVDDVLAVGDSTMLQGFCQRMKEEWEIGEPDWLREDGPAVRFLGMEIELKDGVYRVHQQAYIQNLLEKYPNEKGHGLSAIKTPEEEESPTPEEVQIAQRQTGELLWLAGRTRPDISYGVSLMSQFATKRPKGVQAIGKEIRSYLRTSMDLSLQYGPLEEGDFGEGGSQRRARHESLVEVYTDASFASSNLRSISGVVGFYAGAPVFWITCRQSFVTLSTAESELMSMLEGLTALRCVKSIVSMVQPGVIEGRMYSDSMAGISIVSGTTGSWRTKHLRIRAQGLHEAIDRGETTLEHQSGKLLVADGMTKQLQGGPLQRFIQALKLNVESRAAVQLSSLRVDGGNPTAVRRLRDSVALMTIASTLMMTPVEAAEDIAPGDEDSGIGLILTILVISVLILGDLVTRFGLPKLRSWLWPKDELKVKLLSESAVLPTRGTIGSAGLDLSASENYRIGSGEYVLVKTGIAVELPRGTYGRLASRSSMACMGVEVSAGVIDRDFRGEIKVLIHNQSGRDFWVRRGDRIAQLIVERMMEVEIQQVESLTETSRGRMGFGSTGIESAGPDDQAVRAIRSLRADIPAYIGGSSATRGEEEDQGSQRRISAEELLARRPSPPEVPSGETLVHRCRAPEEEQGDGTASTSQIPHEPRGSKLRGEGESQKKKGGSSATTTMRSSSTSLFNGPPANLGMCSIGAPLPGSWFQESAALNDRAKHFRVQVTDIVPETQARVVTGCPGLIKWSLMRPSEWISQDGESLHELAERSGFAKFWPLHMPELWELLEKDIPSPERDRWCEVQLNQSTVMMVRLHSQLRRKLYDFKNDVMDPQWNYGEIQLTMAKLMNGKYSIIGGHRSGNGGPFLDDRWTGITVFVKIKRA
eukprot:s510_g17.t1